MHFASRHPSLLILMIGTAWFAAGWSMTSDRALSPHNDDWVYVESVRQSVADRAYRLHEYSAVAAQAHIAWGAAWSAVTGKVTYALMRLSNLPWSLLCLLLLYWLMIILLPS